MLTVKPNKRSIDALLGVAVTSGLVSSAAVLSLALPAPVSAQEASVLEELVVTSRRREETLQDAAVSVTAFTADMLQSRSLTNFNNLNNFVPNIELNNGRVDGGGSTAQIFIRGVGQEDYSFPNSPGVGVYLDGVYVSRSSAGDFAFMDIERIEVLRGPQGTLYGKNTIGGAINVVTRKPSGTDSGEVQFTIGRFNRVELMGTADFKLSDQFYAKLSGMSLSRDGYGSNFRGQDLREEERNAVRGQLLYMPTENFEALVQVDFSQQRGTGAVGALRRFWPDDGNGAPTLINAFLAPAIAEDLGLEPPFDVFGPAWVNRIDETKRFFSGAGDETRDNNNIFGASVTLDWGLGPIDAKSITAYRTVEIDVQRDGDHTPFPSFTVGIDEKTYQLSQEIQLSGTALSDRLPWIFGVFAIRERGRNSFRAPLLEGLFEQIGVDLSLLTDTRLDSRSYAVFGEATYYVTDRLGITVGGRLNRDDMEYTYQLDNIFAGDELIPRITLNETWNEFLPKLGLEFSATDDTLVYLTGSRGFKAGGWNPRTLVPGFEPQKFEPEYINTFELGLKTRLWGGRATFNSAVFHSKYRDIQLIAVSEATLPNGTTVVDTIINNAGSGEIRGAEFELVVRPSSQLLFNAGLGLLDTKFTRLGDSVVEAGTATLDNTFIQSPSVTFNAATEYTIDLGNRSSLVLFSDIAYKSKIQRSVQNFEDLVTDPYWIWNGRLTYIPASERWEMAAFVTNITNKIYLANGVDVRALGATEAYYNRPREWGLAFKARF